MDHLDDTPASPVPDHEWTYNAGADTPEHITSDHEEGEAPNSGDEQNKPVSPQPVASDKDDGELAASDNDEDNDNDRSAKSPSVIASDNEEEHRETNAVPNSDDNDEPVVLKRRPAAHIDDSSDEADQDGDEPKSKKRKAAVIDDSDENDETADAEKDEEAAPTKDDDEVEKIMDDIFGGDSDEDGRPNQGQQKQDSSDDDEIRKSRKRSYSGDEEERPRHRWDFDEMMAQKKADRKKTRRRRRDGGIDLISDNDDQIKTLVDQMTRAAALDRASNENRQPAFQKHKLLPVVRQTLLKQDLFEALLDNGMMSAVSDWLAPLPDKSLPSLEIRTTLLKILSDFPNLEQGVLRQSGLGKAVMYLFKHPREDKENRRRAARLIREWSRPIFQLESDFTSMTREERIELDNAAWNRQKRGQNDDASSSSQLRRQSSTDEVLNPGQVGFVSRARVPKPSTRAYVHRPKPVIEGQFHGPSKARSTTRFDIAQRAFKERTKTQKARRHAGPSIAGNKMEI